MRVKFKKTNKKTSPVVLTEKHVHSYIKEEALYEENIENYIIMPIIYYKQIKIQVNICIFKNYITKDIIYNPMSNVYTFFEISNGLAIYDGEIVTVYIMCIIIKCTGNLAE